MTLCKRSIAVMNVGFVLDNIVPRVSSQLNVSIEKYVEAHFLVSDAYVTIATF